MFRLKCFALLLAAGLLSGCQSAAPSPGVGRSVSAGRTTFVEVPTGQGSYQVVAYTISGETTCPECEKVAAEYFKTGVLSEKVCKTCGSTFNVGQGQIINQP